MQHNNNNKSVDVPGQSGAKRGKNTQNSSTEREKEKVHKSNGDLKPKKIAQKIEKKRRIIFLKTHKDQRDRYVETQNKRKRKAQAAMAEG
jgi:hypothetical protein